MAMSSFSEQIFDQFAVQWGMQGGPIHSTTIVSVSGGAEQRQSNWNRPLSKFTMGGDRTLSQTDLNNLVAFFNARRGRAQGFRLRSLFDFQDMGAGVLSGRYSSGNWTVGIPDGTPISAMHKLYQSGSDVLGRRIFKPRQTTISILLNNVLQVENTNYTIDYTTGWLTWSGRQVELASATNASPAVFQTSAAHGLNPGERIMLSGITQSGWVALNEAVIIATVVDPTHFSVAYDSTTWGAFASSSTTLLNVYPQPADAVIWTGCYDTPVRFDADHLSMTVEASYNSMQSGLPFADQVFVHMDSIDLVEIALQEPS